MSSSPEGKEFEVKAIWTPEERLYKGRLAIGTVLFDRLIGANEYDVAYREVLASAGTNDARDFMETLLSMIHEIEDMRILTIKGIGFFMKHPNNLLAGITPLEACVIDEDELALEAARCFADSERGFDPDLAGGRVEMAARQATKHLR